MINYCEEVSGNLKIVSDSGTNYMPTGTGWTLLGFDQQTVCMDYGNGQISLFTESGEKITQCYLNPDKNSIRNYANGNIYFRDTELGINYRLDVINEQRYQMS